MSDIAVTFWLVLTLLTFLEDLNISKLLRGNRDMQSYQKELQP